jgi:hypothetical protein
MFLLFYYLLLCCIEAILSSSSWVVQNDVNQWYNKFNLCILRIGLDKSTEDARKVCYAANEKYTSHMHCEVIVNEWTGCHAKFHFKDQIFYKSFDGSVPTENPLLNFFEKLSLTQKKSKRNGELIFYGDSVTKHLFEAFTCELLRERIWAENDYKIAYEGRKDVSDIVTLNINSPSKR